MAGSLGESGNRRLGVWERGRMRFSFFYCIHCPSWTDPFRQPPPQYLLCNSPASAMHRVGVFLSFPKCLNWRRNNSYLIYFTLYGRVTWGVRTCKQIQWNLVNSTPDNSKTCLTRTKCHGPCLGNVNWLGISWTCSPNSNWKLGLVPSNYFLCGWICLYSCVTS